MASAHRLASRARPQEERRTLLGLPGYGPSQFSITRGDPLIALPLWEVSWFAMDDWRVSPRLTISLGARHEMETGIRDRTNIAPRLAFAWAADKDRKSVLRGGAGIFYDRLESDIIFDTILYDGVRQKQFVIDQPSFFPDIPQSFDGATRLDPALRTRSRDLDAPYVINASIGYERKLPAGLFASVTYNGQRGVHLPRVRNVNAPAPGTGLRPIADRGPILQYESSGVSTRHELALNLKYELRRKLSLFGNYILSGTRSDTESRRAATTIATLSSPTAQRSPRRATRRRSSRASASSIRTRSREIGSSPATWVEAPVR